MAVQMPAISSSIWQVITPWFFISGHVLQDVRGRRDGIRAEERLRARPACAPGDQADGQGLVAHDVAVVSLGGVFLDLGTS